MGQMPQDLYVLQSRILSTEEVITANIFPVIPMFLFISIDSHFALAKRSDNCKCSNDKNNNALTITVVYAMTTTLLSSSTTVQPMTKAMTKVPM